MAQLVLDKLQRRFGDAILETHAHRGDDTAVVQRDRLLEIAQFLKDDPELQLAMPIDNTAVDFLGKREVRFEVIWHLYSLTKNHRVRIKVRVGDGEDAWVPSLTPLWPGMDWHERETWDMYGVRFKGHPNLKRVLMYEEFVGHPLRKDYPIDKRQPLFEERPVRDIPTQRNPPPDLLNRP
jgi:NADH-quinone oxidoreductase subunit C